MGCWRSTPPTCIQRNKMTWDDDRLSFFSAFLPRGHISTLYFGSRTRIIVWLHHISTKLKMISCWHTTLIAGEGKTCNEIGVTAGFKANVITVTPFYQKYYDDTQCVEITQKVSFYNIARVKNTNRMRNTVCTFVALKKETFSGGFQTLCATEEDRHLNYTREAG